MKKESIFKILVIMLIIIGLSLLGNTQVAEASTESIIFDSEYYANMNADLKAAFGYDNSLLRKHWENYGIHEGRKASMVFDVNYYLNNNEDLKVAFGNDYKAACEHFMNYGISEGRKASGLFDIQYYLKENADLKLAFGNDYKATYEHFMNYGISEGRKTSVIFDMKYYLENNEDLKNAFGDNYKLGYTHFATYGISEGRKTSSTFDVGFYLNNNKDLKMAFGDNYEAAYNHYLNFGIKEERNCVPEPITPISAEDISSNPSKYYGQTVNYTPSNGDTSIGWKIFYADDNNIYLIADECIDVSKAPVKNGVNIANNSSGRNDVILADIAKEYSGVSNINKNLISRWLTWGEEYSVDNGNISSKATAYLMDTSIWNPSYGNSYTDYAMGSPTLEMFITSWNAKGYTELSYTTEENGYKISAEGKEAVANDYYDFSGTSGFADTLYYPNGQKTSGYWLASPFAASYVDYTYDPFGSAMATVLYNGKIGPYWTTMTSAYGVRPVVCLKSRVKLEENANGSYAIK